MKAKREDPYALGWTWRDYAPKEEEMKNDQLAVKMFLLNDANESMSIVAFGDTTDEAVAEAEREATERTGDPSWVMNDWGAA